MTDQSPGSNVRTDQPGLRRLALSLKRAIDVVVALVGLLCLSPVLLGIAAAVRLTMGPPLLFRQVRPGLHERSFALVKFRTMVNPVTADGRQLTPLERVTGLGWFLRRTSLDELPQLWNVLRGDVSLVGPRPLLVEYLPYYSEREQLRHTVRPGITGLAQVTGRNLLSWEDKLELDVRYVERWSLWLDIQILAKTALRVLRSSGVANDPEHEGALNLLRQVRSAESGIASRGS
jgi:lipopolysaccharide/colanic/teichoic acid biosynthesis glycosyltransferase